MAFRIEITAVNISGRERQGGQKRKIIREEIYKAVLFITHEMRKVLAVENSQVVSGQMKQSWQTNTNVLGDSIVGRVASNSVAAKVFEMGAKRHFPPMYGRRHRLKGARGRGRLVFDSANRPALEPWILRAPRARGFSWRKFNTTDPRDVDRLAFVIGRKFKALGRRKELKFSRAVDRNKMRFAFILNQAMRNMADRLRGP